MVQFLVHYMLAGKAKLKNQATIKHAELYKLCCDYIEYAEKYDVLGAHTLLGKYLAQLVYDEAEGDWDSETELGDKGFLIRTIFK
jgi:hypothetical protein